MRMPRRADFGSGEKYLAAVDQWKKQGDDAYAALRTLYDATPEFSERPAWLEKAPIRHIGWNDNGEEDASENLEARLQALSSSLAEDDLKVVRLCHGKVDHEEGFPYRGIYVEVARSAGFLN